MRVHSHDKYAEVGEFEPTTGELKVFHRTLARDEQPPRGHFAQIGNDFAILYRETGELHLRVAGRVMKLDDEATVAWRRKDSRYAELVVRADDKEVVLTYQLGPLTGPPLSLDPTPFISPEDWDFGLFVYNVFHDKKRRDGIYQRMP